MRDYIDLFNEHDREMQKIEDSMPRCCKCGQPIWDYYYDVYGDIFCEDCADSEFLKRIS